MKISNLVGYFSFAFFAGIIVLPWLIKYFKKLGVLDQPNWRSAHTNPTPSSGGISYFIALLLMIPFFSENAEIFGSVLAAALLGIMGFADDKINLKPKLKFSIQIFAATIVYFSGVKLKFLNGFLGLYEVNDVFAYSFTVLLTVAIINAYNLIDGVDGLAAGLAVIASTVFCVIFIINGDYAFTVFAISLTGSLLAFLHYNFNPAKIFMGDTGSLIIGLVLSVFFIRVFSNFSSYSTVAISVLLFPVIDMVRLFVVRILTKKSPFEADNNHYHHLLIKLGNSHKKVAITGYLISLSQLVIGIIASYFFSLTISVFMTIALSFLMYVFSALEHYKAAQNDEKSIKKNMTASTKRNFLIADFNEK